MVAGWQQEVLSALTDFSAVSDLAKDRILFEDEDVEFLPAPHRRPRNLSRGKMAVYGFCFDGSWLKIGMVGPNSGARYASQHYGFNALSTLAKSLSRDDAMRKITGLGENSPAEWGEWVERNTSRMNILLPSSRDRNLLSLLEAFLLVRLRPKYEG